VIAFEAKHFPLVLLDLGSSERKPDELREVFVRFREVNQRATAEGKRWALVAVTDSPPNAIERKVISEESSKFSAAEHALTLAAVLVIPNGVIRAVVTALTWMIPKMAPLASAPTTSAAVDLAVERLRGIGVDCPAELTGPAKRWFLRNATGSVPPLRKAAGGDTQGWR
jgi:hypothetical protein